MTEEKKIEHKLWAWLMANKVIHRLGLLPTEKTKQLQDERICGGKALTWEDDEEKYWTQLVKGGRVDAIVDHIKKEGVDSIIDELTEVFS